jgi:hypothetical protein
MAYPELSSQFRLWLGHQGRTFKLDSSFLGIPMRAPLFCLVGLITMSSGLAISELAFAEMKLSTRASPSASETRYFTSIDGLMDGNADVILKESRQGKTLTSAVLDVCYPAEKGSDRKDRFVANLSVNGQSLTGTTESLGDKLPVTVRLIRKQTGDSFEFKGQISIGQTVTEVDSADNSDLSEVEFKNNQATDDTIATAPKDFTEVSPEAIGVRIKLDGAAAFLKALKGQELEVALNSLSVSCDALRAGEQTVNISVDPYRAAALLAKFRALPGVVAAGWTGGVVEMERTIRFAAADWRDGELLNRDKLATAVGKVLSKTLSATPVSANWNANTGVLKLTLKRPSRLMPALDLTETIEIAALVAPDKPDASDRLILWIGTPVSSTKDEGSGATLNLADDNGGDEESEPPDDNDSVAALAKEFKGQRWDADKLNWK